MGAATSGNSLFAGCFARTVVFTDIDRELCHSTKEAGSGIAVNEVWRKHGIGSATYYKWKAKYGGLDVSELVRVKELGAENSQLKRMYANLALENEAIKAV